MNSAPLDLEAPASWPEVLRAYLAQHHDFFLDWETKREWATGAGYDRAVYGLESLLRQYSLVGWHCTRLTEDEIAHIRSGGMQPMDAAMLERRLDAVVAAGLLTETMAGKLKARHQAREPSRAGRVWFCFFPPRHAGELGIGRFFRHWGGEALYNSHEDDPETGAALRSVGVPCVIEALVPLSSLGSLGFLPEKIARRHLIAHGHQTVEPIDHEGAITSPLEAARIRRTALFPSRKFGELTGCDGWRAPVAG
ncbi:hypothetical protein JYK14_07820 [Siccirubricoccus sp. KC 17139]|uniref:Uncharacterized protein n=1 Tax=Siccirubricoccus soli TaxID=2899147 RepID=A0ABT1D2B6_9PROT|nr:hypothetical protein [Siccirubricoccus soli]MCO6416077.1 hypothetical protein [Siccirubricoccus soli]MCP2682209.1 hypothetical protein [Siccirubricoccus soli]